MLSLARIFKYPTPTGSGCSSIRSIPRPNSGKTVLFYTFNQIDPIHLNNDSRFKSKLSMVLQNRETEKKSNKIVNVQSLQ